MNDIKRYFIAGILIFLVIILQPFYLKWLGYDPARGEQEKSAPNISKQPVSLSKVEAELPSVLEEKNNPSTTKEQFITISSPLYTATLSSRSGGSFVEYILNETNSDKLKYLGGYSNTGIYLKDGMVSIILPSENSCQPCLAYFDDSREIYNFYNQVFITLNSFSNNDTVYIGLDDKIKLSYKLLGEDGKILISKTVTFSGDSYISQHVYKINENDLDYNNNIELVWYGGLRPTEEKEDEDIQYASAIISQAGEIEDLQTTDPEDNLSRRVYNGKTDWVAVRTKYFMSALLVDNAGKYAALSAENKSFGDRRQTPVYHAALGFPFEETFVSADLYLGPLDIDHISKTNTNLDETMNWGFSLIQPISKGILWLLKFTHNSLKLNYGLVLLLFALLIRVLTGPLTKKSYESSQKMQKLQPQIKALQAKYKKDPQRLNRETMQMYKKHKVNPLGGCLPIVLQMPLLWALFVVFRSTIEFRGAPFVLWITDLSQPDVVFSLPFSVPIYGSGVAILPLIMGATLMLTMRMSSATMDKSQKPVMYFMNGFFILLFNTFPSGLNLYYTAYNLLSFLQQQSIRKKLIV